MNLINLMILSLGCFSLWGPVNIAIFNTLLLMLVVSHMRAVTCDPGMVPLPATRLDFSHLHSGKSRVSYVSGMCRKVKSLLKLIW